MTRISRPLVAALLLLVGCSAFGGNLTREERDRLALYQSNAALYYEGRRYDQALDMVRRGLELDPDDYKLQSVAGWCYLQTSVQDSDRLLEAERYFDSIYGQRSPDEHQPQALLGYAATKQRLGREHERLAETLTREAETRDLSQTERTIRTARAQEHAQRARSYWGEAVNILDDLLAREELLRFAHKLLMEIYVELGDYDAAVRHAELCLERNHDEQELQNAIIRETLVVASERKARGDLQELIEQEEKVRSGLAEMHFRREAFQAAVEQLDALLSLDPTRSTDYYNRGVALERLGRREDARRDFEKFLGTTALPSNDERVAHAFEFTRNARGA